MSTNLTLGRVTGTDGFRAAVAKWCTEGAQTARNLENLKTAQSLDDLAEYVATLDLGDQTGRLLFSISSAAGWGTEGTWTPGESAADFRANVGYSTRPSPAEALAELAAVCNDDYIAAAGEQRSSANRQVQEAQAKVDLLAGAVERASAFSAENDQLRAENAQVRAELAEAVEQIDHLKRRHLPDLKTPNKKPSAKAGTNGDRS